MGELARRRDERDVWISRSHLKAAVAGIVLVSGVSFGLGYVTGRDAAPVQEARPTSLAAQVPGDELVELLARVEATAAPDGGVTALTFPDALQGQPSEAGDGLVAPVGPQPVADPVVVVGDGGAEAAFADGAGLEAQADARPRGEATVEVARLEGGDEALALRDHLRERGLDAWASLELIDGATVWTVGVGAFDGGEAAAAELERVDEALDGAPVGAEPSVAEL